ncbi:B3GT2 galactosyltransferase, partial [Upupa epops]|nr:B3GT2 galactosyltransferase [Upupa epops]
PHKCRHRTPFLVLLVASAAPDMAGRAAIRRTWGDENWVPGVSVLRLFLLGVPPVFGAALQPQLQEESLAHGDLV